MSTFVLPLGLFECFFKHPNAVEDFHRFSTLFIKREEIKEKIKGSQSIREKMTIPIKKTECFFLTKKLTSLLAKNFAITFNPGNPTEVFSTAKKSAALFINYIKQIDFNERWKNSTKQDIHRFYLDLKGHCKIIDLKSKNLSLTEAKVHALGAKLLLDPDSTFNIKDQDLTVSFPEDSDRLYRFKISTIPLPQTSAVFPVRDLKHGFPLFVIKKEKNLEKRLKLSEMLGVAYGIQFPPKQIENEKNKLTYLYCTGGDLFDKKELLSIEAKFLLLFPVFCGLHHMHSNGVAWVDGKGENIFLQGSSPFISDIDGSFCSSLPQPQEIITSTESTLLEDVIFLFNHKDSECYLEEAKKIDVFQCGVLMSGDLLGLQIPLKSAEFKEGRLSFIHLPPLLKQLNYLIATNPTDKIYPLIKEMLSKERASRPSIEEVFERFADILAEKELLSLAFYQMEREGFDPKKFLPKSVYLKDPNLFPEYSLV